MCFCQRNLALSSIDVDNGIVGYRKRIVWVQLLRFTGVNECLIEPALKRKEECEVVVGPSVAGLELDCEVELPLGLLVFEVILCEQDSPCRPRL